MVNAIGNSYNAPSPLFVDGKTLMSQERTTQGDPLVMAMYGVALLPLMKLVKEDTVIHKWYADDMNAVGTIEAPKTLHEKLKEHGPAFRYNLTKCNIITKEDLVQKALETFSNDEMAITTGNLVLGSTIGCNSSCHTFKEEPAIACSKIVKQLSQHAKMYTTRTPKVYKIMSLSFNEQCPEWKVIYKTLKNAFRKN